MQRIEKTYPGVRALRGVDLTLHAGQVLALLGENGAGKSTLIKILGGAVSHDAGTIHIQGQPVQFANPQEALAAGIGIIYQEFNLVPGLKAWENIFLGRESTRILVDRSVERRRAQEIFSRMGAVIDIEALCGDLSVAQRQLVEIAKALSQDVRVLVMDEPSATLSPQEVAYLFRVIEDLKGRGIGVIYISHRLDEIFQIADRVLVLRDGQGVGESAIDDVTRKQMIEWMVGRSIQQEFPKVRQAMGHTRLAVRGLTRGAAVRDVTFELRAGEVLGLTGLVGAGRTETARLIFGADPIEKGTIQLDGRTLTLRSPRDAIQAGICLLTEDRKLQGLVLQASVRQNFGLPNLRRLSRLTVLRQARERSELASYVEKLRIKVSSQEQLAKHLSGGNQQKIVLAKWLSRHAEILIFDEPTRGIDVGAKYEIYMLINELAASGKGIIVISSELPEVLGISDRILVMHDGRITGEIIDPQQATPEQIMQLAIA